MSGNGLERNIQSPSVGKEDNTFKGIKENLTSDKIVFYNTQESDFLVVQSSYFAKIIDFINY